MLMEIDFNARTLTLEDVTFSVEALGCLAPPIGVTRTVRLRRKSVNGATVLKITPLGDVHDGGGS